jgi:hypothetical protein
MADTFKILAQVKPSATTLTDAYTVPGATTAVVSSVVICNQSAVATSYRISAAVAGLADTAKQYLAYDVSIPGNTTQTLTLGISLGATDVIRVYNTLATLSFNIFGVQVT